MRIPVEDTILTLLAVDDKRLANTIGVFDRLAHAEANRGRDETLETSTELGGHLGRVRLGMTLGHGEGGACGSLCAVLDPLVASSDSILDRLDVEVGIL